VRLRLSWELINVIWGLILTKTSKNRRRNRDFLTDNCLSSAMVLKMQMSTPSFDDPQVASAAHHRLCPSLGGLAFFHMF
jgi:hypothetical protein